MILDLIYIVFVTFINRLITVLPAADPGTPFWAAQMESSIRWWLSWGDALIGSTGHTLALITLFTVITVAGSGALVVIGILNIWHKLHG